ncbi:MAG: hypothetical protein J5852_00060 [Clostridia bacterium]|nr:hypothetical protein [Clostridia bacterium]
MFNSVTLEISLKPFKETGEQFIRKVCSDVLKQWFPLIKDRKTVSILLWVGDGSEILDYTGNLDDEFEWAYYIGTANREILSSDDHFAESLHTKKRFYADNPPLMTYSLLKKIVSVFKEEGQKICPDSIIRVGETFDIGPEFAVSDFKYRRHKEISRGTRLDDFGFVDATAELAGDERYYAAYKSGIPQGTLFGTFLGKQAQVFLSDIGFDYLWLSNGLGFSAHPWSLVGKIYDGRNFYPEKLLKTKNDVFKFWKLFRDECSFPVETRGTNNTVGIDYATDGVPLYDIYNSGFDITPPPNSPWAAINDNIGLEIMGHMTRICELPKNDFKFRFYIHDPWWVNSPWYDRYNSSPYDIYLPMAISRIDESGSVQSAQDLNILSVDNSFGDLPDSCVYEPLPHILKSETDSSDEPAPFVLVYPFREFTTTNDSNLLKEMYFGDRFMVDAINSGFPLNCVVSSDNFLKIPPETLKKSVIVSPLQVNKEVVCKLNKMANNGCGVIFYSSGLIPDDFNGNKNIVSVNTNDPVDALLSSIKRFGYEIKFQSDYTLKLPSVAVNRSNNALIFSVYNRNTTTAAYLGFPLGAPVLDSYDVELTEGKAKYVFPKCVHNECRVFVRQERGVVSVREAAPVSGYYRRRILISGLENATVFFFPETYCKQNCDFADASECTPDSTPVYSDLWKPEYDEKYGYYYKAENISGKYFALMPFD